MILDLEEFPEDAELSCDVCIAGGGAAGIALALELASSRLGVIMLESGGLRAEEATRELNRAAIVGDEYAGAWYGRARVLGGATTLWGGQALPLIPLDLAPRAWVPHSGWPISWDVLATHYARAMAFLGLDGLGYDDDLIAFLGIDRPRFDPARVRYHISRWSPSPDMARRHGSRLRSTVDLRVMLHANVVELELDEPGTSIHGVRARTLGGRRLDVRARHVVLATGGLETARLLLAGSSRMPKGIGDGREMVGRFLQDHPGGRIGTLVPRDSDRLQYLFNQFYKGGRKYSVRCSAAPDWQRDHAMLNASAAVMFDVRPDSAFAAAREVYHLSRRGEVGAKLIASALRTARGIPELLRPVWEYYAKGRRWTPGAVAGVFISLEQAPDPESRLRLGPTRDAVGLPVLEIDWRLGDRTIHSGRAFARELAEQFRAAGIGELMLEPWVLDDRDSSRTPLGDHYHHLGTTRMGSTPHESVVDAHCRVHGVANLHVASTSVFPTGGHSNPTLTLLALCYRLADRLRAVM